MNNLSDLVQTAAKLSFVKQSLLLADQGILARSQDASPKLVSGHIIFVDAWWTPHFTRLRLQTVRTFGPPRYRMEPVPIALREDCVYPSMRVLHHLQTSVFVSVHCWPSGARRFLPLTSDQLISLYFLFWKFFY